MAGGVHWTTKELNLLRIEYVKGGAEAAHKALPHRTLTSIRTYAKKQKLHVSEMGKYNLRLSNLAKSCFPPWDLAA